MIKELKVAIIVTALNEEQNIGSLLSSLLIQNIKDFVLNKILVISDGSTDDTVKIVKSYKSKIIKLENHKVRMGKAARLAEAFKKLQEDIFVIIDADVAVAHKNVIREMVLPFQNQEKLGMVGGNSQPFKANNFLQHAICASFNVYSGLRKKYNSLSFGPLIAYRSSLAKKVKFPERLFGEDAFGYLSCLSFKYKYHYSEKALVYIKTPQNLREHISQNVRFSAAPQKMTQYFSEELVTKENYISPIHLYPSLLKELIKNPLYSICIFLINQYCRLLAMFNKDTLDTKWEVSKSTK